MRMFGRFVTRYGLWLTIIFLFVIHLPYLPNGFVWLDHGDIERGRAIVPLLRLPEAFLHRFGETGFYRPVVTVVTSIDAAVYGTWAPGYHLTNLLIHLAVALAAGYFLSCFFPLTKGERVLVTLMVGVAPVSFLPVGVISYRQELLYAVFSLLAVVFFAKKKYAYANVSFLMAVLSKETAVVIVPALLFLWDVTRGNFTSQKQGLKKTLQRFIGPGMILIVYFFVRRVAVPENWHISPVVLSMSQGIGTRLWAVGHLGVQLITPVLLGFSDATPIIPITHPISLIVLAVLLTSVWTVWKEGVGSTIGIWVLLLCITLIPAFNVVPLPRFSSPHYGYLASVIVAMIPLFLLKTTQKSRLRYMVVVGTGVWIICASYWTFRAGFRLRSDNTLFLPEVTRDTHFREGFSYLGDAAFFSGRSDDAVRWYEAAMADTPGFLSFVDRTSVVNNAAGALLAQNRLDEANVLLGKIPLKDNSQLSLSIRYNRALIAYKLGRYEETIALLHGEYPWKRNEPLYLLLEAKRKLETK